MSNKDGKQPTYVQDSLDFFMAAKPTPKKNGQKKQGSISPFLPTKPKK